MGVSEEEQITLAKDESISRRHNKKMYEQKEYMEEWLKFKEVIAGMKKWAWIFNHSLNFNKIH